MLIYNNHSKDYHMSNRKQRFRPSNENGFTLIELLVVMIIIGILAAVAIPIFLNQQKTARDTATVTDVRNFAALVQDVRVRCPYADVFQVTSSSANMIPVTLTKSDGTTVGPFNSWHTLTYDTWKSQSTRLRLYKQPSPSTTSCMTDGITLSEGTVLHFTEVGGFAEGEFLIYGWNPRGKNYNGDSVLMTGSLGQFPDEWLTNVVVYDSRTGGIKK